MSWRKLWGSVLIIGNTYWIEDYTRTAASYLYALASYKSTGSISDLYSNNVVSSIVFNCSVLYPISHTSHVVYVSFYTWVMGPTIDSKWQKREAFQKQIFFICSLSFYQKSTERKQPKDIFFDISFYWDVPYKPTHYLQNPSCTTRRKQSIQYIFIFN